MRCIALYKSLGQTLTQGLPCFLSNWKWMFCSRRIVRPAAIYNFSSTVLLLSRRAGCKSGRFKN